MKIVFRLNFHTVPGQSLWLKLATTLKETGVRFEQVLPLHWINAQQWEVDLDVEGGGAMELEYSYQFREESNGVELEEWNGPRHAAADPASQDALLLLDTWCSAGTVDYAFETKAFQAVMPARGPFMKPVVSSEANHTFQLRMAAVPEGLVPCLLGSVSEIGDWGWHHALPLLEVEANVWQTSAYLPADWWIEYKYGMYDAKLGCVVSLEAGENRTLASRQRGERQWTMVRDECYRRDSNGLYRAAGVAIPVFSLRSDKGLGVGEFADLKELADWASGIGMKLIQILPINDTTSSHDWTDSYPYSAISVFALHPLYLRIEDMGHAMPASFHEELDSSREWLNTMEHLDYEEVMKAKAKLTREVFTKHQKAIVSGDGFQKFLAENREWVVPYAVFCVKRDHYGTADFSKWGEWSAYSCGVVDAMAEASHPECAEVFYHIWLQYELDKQLADAVDHLHQCGLALKGDLPIGIDRQSVDAWAAPHLFKMDSQAGAPPDAFAVKGQNWGFPTYNWEIMREDGYAWWRSRFAQLSRYFDAYRIDHILGFFRIWQVPYEQVEGIMGWFDPALPVHIDEIRNRGIQFDFNRHCRPYIREHFLWERFGETTEEVKAQYLDACGYGYYQLREHVSNQRRIVEHFATWNTDDLLVNERAERMKHGLLDCASDVLFLEVPGSLGTLFHPRCSLHMTRSFQELDHDAKWRVDDLYVDYFYRRQENFWQARGYEKLPVMRRASSMLLCGEDLGMVPACVPGVLKELGILSLEIQRMPKASDTQFANLAHAPYMSVVSPSTHDMPTLRGWWHEDPHVTGNFAWQMLGLAFPKMNLSGEIAATILLQHLQSPAMWTIFPLQDLLAIDEELRNPDIDAERINVPAIMPYYWRYRMHLGMEELSAAEEFNGKIERILRATGRALRG
ncbi:MAG: 4-alpha-glucanotransferase [Gloeobacteraceae cyanobacterium ES-bin-144]|nr:4-alpha-glucanotransferase [Verrucomicrobiales bacterium]